MKPQDYDVRFDDCFSLLVSFCFVLFSFHFSYVLQLSNKFRELSASIEPSLRERVIGHSRGKNNQMENNIQHNETRMQREEEISLM